MSIIKFYKWLKKQLLSVLPPFVFFVLSFSFLDLVESDLLKRAGITPFSFLEIIIASALVAKVLLVIDHLPIVNLFPKRPLIYNIVWKTFIYSSFTLLARLAIRIYPFLSSSETTKGSLQDIRAHVNWQLFFTVQAFYFILFAIFVVAKELTVKIGADRLKKILFKAPYKKK